MSERARQWIEIDPCDTLFFQGTESTETGLVLDHTSGMPYIPAAGQKGVLRLAHLVNSLKNGDDWLSEEELRERRIVDENMNWLEDDSSRALFGAGGGNDALAGRLNILDAYPLLPPGTSVNKNLKNGQLSVMPLSANGCPFPASAGHRLRNYPPARKKHRRSIKNCWHRSQA